jgi:hypothetical protein
MPPSPFKNKQKVTKKLPNNKRVTKNKNKRTPHPQPTSHLQDFL